jgi:hypothetical protein
VSGKLNGFSPLTRGQEVVGMTVKQNPGHPVDVYPFSCSEITFRKMSAAQIFTV